MFRMPKADSGRRSNPSGSVTPPTSPLVGRVSTPKAGKTTPRLNTTFDSDPTVSVVRRLSGKFEKPGQKPTTMTSKPLSQPTKAYATKTSQPLTQGAKPRPAPLKSKSQSSDPQAKTAEDVIADSIGKPTLEGLLDVVSFATIRMGDTRNMKSEIKHDIVECLKHVTRSLTTLKATDTPTLTMTEALAPKPHTIGADPDQDTVSVHQKLNTILSELHLLRAEGATITAITAPPQKEVAQRPATLHSVIVTSTNDQDTGDAVIEQIREAVDAKEGWVTVSKIRKAKERKVIISCDTKEEREKLKKRIDASGKGLKTQNAQNKDPLVIVKNILKARTDTEILEAMTKQNKAVFQGLSDEDKRITIKYKKKARNPHTHHVVMTTSPIIWTRITAAGYVHIDLQRVKVEDQSPLVRCTQCLGYGHSRGFCREKEIWCSHCGEPGHVVMDCPTWTDAGAPASCRNCSKAQMVQREHNAFSSDCPIRKKWDRLARSAVAYC